MHEPLDFASTVFVSGHERGLAARVTFEESALRARTRDGADFYVRYQECQLERGGANANTWLCRTPDRSVTILSTAPGFPAALRAHAARELGAALDAIEQRAGSRRKRMLLAWAVAGGIALSLIALSRLGIRQAGGLAVDVLPTSLDRQLGEAAFASMRQEGPRLQDPAVLARVRGVVDRLTVHAEPGFSFSVHVIDADVRNAYALPGGIVVVYTGLLAAAETPEQLAGVLAHEISHVTRRHGVRRIAHSVGTLGAIQLLFGDVSGLAGIAVQVLSVGTVNSYSREQEREADLDAVRMLARAGIDPAALAEFFRVLLRREGAGAPAIRWLSTHPDLEQRIAEIDRAAARARARKP